MFRLIRKWKKKSFLQKIDFVTGPFLLALIALFVLFEIFWHWKM